MTLDLLLAYLWGVVSGVCLIALAAQKVGVGW